MFRRSGRRRFFLEADGMYRIAKNPSGDMCVFARHNCCPIRLLAPRP